MDNNIYKLLDYLANTGVGVEKDIANPLSEIFVPPTVSDRPHYASLLQRFLGYMIDDGLIHMTERPDKSLGERHDTQGFRWLVGDWPISAAITLKGYELLSQEKDRQAGRDLDGSIRKTNEFTRDNGRLTLGVAILALIVAAAGVIKDIIDHKCCQPALQQTIIPHIPPQSELDTLKKSLFELRNSLNELKSASTKDTSKTPVLRNPK